MAPSMTPVRAHLALDDEGLPMMKSSTGARATTTVMTTTAMREAVVAVAAVAAVAREVGAVAVACRMWRGERVMGTRAR